MINVHRFFGVYFRINESREFSKKFHCLNLTLKYYHSDLRLKINKRYRIKIKLNLDITE